MFLFVIALLIQSVLGWIEYGQTGFASMTHYDLPRDSLAACGCTAGSTHYPTAALSQMAYGSSNAFGPSCGKCFNLTLLNTFLSDPSFYPNPTKSLVVKVTDLCPLSDNGWCSGTESKTNEAGHQLNFDLAYPSQAIPDDFYPSNVELYGYEDFGVWNISYQVIPCTGNWAGASDEFALGSASNLGREGACCPANPTGNASDTCPSYSDQNGIAPDTTTNAAAAKHDVPLMYLLSLVLLYTRL